MFQLSGVHCKVFLLGVLGVERAVGLGRAVLGASGQSFRIWVSGFRV